MDEIQDIESTPTPVRWLVLVAGVLTAVWLIGKKVLQVYRCIDRIDDLLRDWFGYTAEDGTRVPGVMERLERIEDRLAALEKSGGDH